MHAFRVLAPLALLVVSCAGPSQSVRHRELAAAWERAAPPAAAEDPFAGHAALERSALVAAVLARNPSLEAARWAWRAALARHPQETAPPDPMLDYTLAPASVGASGVDTGQRIAITQALPFPGKLSLRGEIALAEAEAAARDHDAVRLRLALLASWLYDELVLVERKLAVNDAHRLHLAELREIALIRYEAGAASQQDPLEAEIAEAELLHRDVVLRADQRVAVAQLNALLHRTSEAPLPPLPAQPEPPAAANEAPEALFARARAERPELRAAEARIAARESALALARRESLPDLALMGGYDSFEEASRMRPMVGLALNLPLQRARREGAVDEAEAELAGAHRERASLEDQVRLSTLRAFERLREAHHALEIVRDRQLPAAKDRLAAARAAFETGQNDFSALIDAERTLRDAELMREEAAVEISRRHAELARATGALPGGMTP